MPHTETARFAVHGSLTGNLE